MDVVVNLHGQMGRALVVYFMVCAAWGIVLGARGAGPSSSYLGALVVAEIAALAQGTAGALSWLVSRPPSDLVHILYGLSIAVALPLASTYVRDRSPRRASLTYGFVCLFAFGLAVRGLTTAGTR